MQAAIETAELYATTDEHTFQFSDAAYDNDVYRMQSLLDALPVPIASPHRASAVKAFVDFRDPQLMGAATYAAAESGALEALRLLRELLPPSELPKEGLKLGAEDLQKLMARLFAIDSHLQANLFI